MKDLDALEKDIDYNKYLINSLTFLKEIQIAH